MMGNATAVDAYNLIRDVCTQKLLWFPGTVVQIDESLMRHNRKVDKPGNLATTSGGNTIDSPTCLII